MNNALFLYRFHCREPFSKWPELPTYQYRPGIFVHTMEKALQLEKSLKVPFQFVCMFDNSTPSLIERCEKKMKEMIGESGVSVIENCLDDLDTHNHPLRIYEDGRTTNKYLHGSWTFYVTGMNEIRKRANNDTVIFFSECDYLYRDESFIKGFQMIDANDGDFVTLYEHPQVYEVDKGPEWQRRTKEFAGHCWRPATSTCLTFLGTLKAINKYPQMFLEADNDFGDCAMWGNIHRIGGSTLWMSVPTLAYHCFSHNLRVNGWSELFRSMIEKGDF